MADPLKEALVVLEGELLYKPYDDDDPSNTDRTVLDGVPLDGMLSSFSGHRVHIEVRLLEE